MIKILGGRKDPRKTWERLMEAHPPRSCAPMSLLPFPGQGQRATPVAKDKEGVLYILGLLPGEVGRKYRQSDRCKTYFDVVTESSEFGYLI